MSSAERKAKHVEQILVGLAQAADQISQKVQDPDILTRLSTLIKQADGFDKKERQDQLDIINKFDVIALELVTRPDTRYFGYTVGSLGTLGLKQTI